MSRIATITDKAPAPLPVYNQAIVANGFVYTSGSIAQDPATGKVIDGDIQAHTVSYPRESRMRQASADSRYLASGHQEPGGRARGLGVQR